MCCLQQFLFGALKVNWDINFGNTGFISDKHCEGKGFSFQVFFLLSFVNGKVLVSMFYFCQTASFSFNFLFSLNFVKIKISVS